MDTDCQDRVCTSALLQVYSRQANPDLLARVGGRMQAFRKFNIRWFAALL
jgi:hypothetical protein